MPLLKAYNQAIASGKLQNDAAQHDVAERLNRLLATFLKKERRSLLRTFFGPAVPAPRGLYIWGPVGRGKTMLMDMFFESLLIRRKRRAHFHAFMRDVHARIFKERGKGTDNPLLKVANELAAESRLLCFDEMVVTDVADAMILSRLFTQIFARGTVVVATSNMPPDDLYKGGLNHSHFDPFIALLKEKMDIVRLDAKKDFRLEKLEKSGVYFTGEDAKQKFDAAWRSCVQGQREYGMYLNFKGRSLRVPRTVSGACRFTFADLCEAPLGAEDYLELAADFHTIFIEAIPCFYLKQRNAIRRFINLIDILYDNGVKLIASAEAEPLALMEDMDGHEAEAYPRTASRLMEMRSTAYLTRQHLREHLP